MQTVDGRYVIVLNGEIYNYVELREQLGRLGHRFHSRSDTEVLLTAFAHWGPGCLERLVGMFAFAVLDTRDKTVFLARDYFGIKPLYVASTPGGLVFASEIGALLELGQLPRTVDAARLFAYLRYGITDHGDGSLFAEVQQVPAGGCTLIDIDHTGPPEFRCYWQPGGRPRAELSLDEATRRVRDLFLDSVRLHLRSDVPVGSALSGGIDSSAIVMAMRRLGGPELVLHTFSFVPADEALSEERWVDVVVDAAHTTAHKVHVSPEELSVDWHENTASRSCSTVRGRTSCSGAIGSTWPRGWLRWFGWDRGPMRLGCCGRAAAFPACSVCSWCCGARTSWFRHDINPSAGRWSGNRCFRRGLRGSGSWIAVYVRRLCPTHGVRTSCATTWCER